MPFGAGSRRWTRNGGFVALLSAAGLLCGCASLLSPRSGRVSCPDPGGIIVLPRPDATATRITTIHTRRTSLPLDAKGTGKAKLYQERPDEREWVLLAPEPMLGIPILDTSREGTYRIATASGPLRAGTAIRPLLEVRVDRALPKILLQRELTTLVRGGTTPSDDILTLRWRIEEPDSPGGQIEVSYSSNGGSSWWPLPAHGPEGMIRWAMPRPPWEPHRLRVRAWDLAGNRAERDFPLWQPEWAGRWDSGDAEAVAASPSVRETPPSAVQEPRPAPAETAAETPSAPLPPAPAPATVAPEQSRDEEPEALASANPEPAVELPAPSPVESGPRPLNFSGERFRGGASHYLFLSAPERSESGTPLDVRIVPEAGGEPAWSERVAYGSPKVLVEMPAESGLYRVELDWTDVDGRPHRALGSAPFEVDADPPRLEWIDAPRAVSASAVTKLRVAGDAPSAIARWLYLFREAGATEWREISPASVARENLEGGETRLRIDTAAWPEGEWELAALAEDDAGNVAPEPARLAHSILVDRTPPDIAPATLVTPVIEGMPLLFEWKSVTEPPSAQVRWAPSGAAGDRHDIAWRSRDGEWRGTAPALAPGVGTLALVLTDAAGNIAERSNAVEVGRAVRVLRTVPASPLSPGASFFLEYEMAPPLPEPARPVEVRLLASEQVLASVPLEARGGRVRLEAPRTVGDYRLRVFVVGSAVPFQSDTPLVVAARDVAAATPAMSPARSFDQSTGRPVAALEPGDDLLVAFRDFKRRWTQGERGEEIESRRAGLRRGLEQLLERDPGATAARRALAQLAVYREPPDLEAASALLGERLRLTRTGSDDDLPEVLNDLAAIALKMGRADLAEGYLLHAVRIEDSALRRYNLGEAYMLAKRWRDAETAFRRAVEREPERIGYRQAWARAAALLLADERPRVERTLEEWQSKGILTRADRDALEAAILASTSR